MTGRSLGFVVIETTRREGEADDSAICPGLPFPGDSPLYPEEEQAGKIRDRLEAHAAVDADLHEGVTFSYTVAEVVSR